MSSLTRTSSMSSDLCRNPHHAKIASFTEERVSYRLKVTRLGNHRMRPPAPSSLLLKPAQKQEVWKLLCDTKESILTAF